MAKIDTRVTRLTTSNTGLSSDLATARTIKQKIRTVAESKGVTVANTDTPYSLLQKIDQAAIVPSGTINIGANGTVDVTNYASASVSVASQGDAVAKGLADGSLTSFSAPALGVTSLKTERFRNFTNLQSLDLTGVTSIPEYTANGCTALTSLTLDSDTTNIGQYAFSGCNNANIAINIDMNGSIDNNAFYGARVRSLKGTYTKIGNQCFTNSSSNDRYMQEMDIKVNGSIGYSAFEFVAGEISSFRLDPTSNITSLSGNNTGNNGPFAYFGRYRANPSSNIFTFDFRNSTFSQVPSSCFGKNFSGSGCKYANIYFNDKMTNIYGSYAFGGVDYVNIYYQNVPSLSNTNAFQNATNFKNFFPYNLVQKAKTSTNWSSSTNNIVSSIFGYSAENTFSLGDTLPDTDADGYALTWYSDSAMTQQVTTVSDPTQIYYCSVGSQIKTPLAITEYQATCTLSDGVNTYTNGDLVPIGSTVTITAVSDTGYPNPYIFTLNGATISSGDTYTPTTASIFITCIYYDGVNPPVEPVFADNSPAQIKIAVDNGLHRTLWNIGDTKEITLTNGEQYTIRYIDSKANRYLKSDNSGYTNAVFEFTHLFSTTYPIALANRYPYFDGGWYNCTLNTTTLPMIFNDLFPTEWKNVISQCKIGSAICTPTDQGSVVYADDYLFVASGQEMYGNSPPNGSNQRYSLDEGCTIFDYYNQLMLARPASGDRYTAWCKLKYGETVLNYNNAPGYYLRSPNARNFSWGWVAYFCTVGKYQPNASGTLGSHNTGADYPGFFSITFAI